MATTTYTEATLKTGLQWGDLITFGVGDTTLGGATSHSVQVSPEFIDVLCKDAPNGVKILSKVNYEFSSDGYVLKDNVDATAIQKLIDDDTNLTVTCEGISVTNGKISSFSINAPSGDLATYSITITASVSKIDKSSAGA